MSRVGDGIRNDRRVRALVGAGGGFWSQAVDSVLEQPIAVRLALPNDDLVLDLRR